MSAAHDSLTRGERVFRALLLLYPRSFRDRFMDEMLDFFRARHDEQRHRFGARGLVRLWTHLIADIGINAPLQHVRALRSTSARCRRASLPSVLHCRSLPSSEKSPPVTSRRDARCVAASSA